MHIRAVLAALAFWLAPSLAFAQAGTADATCTAALTNRAQFGVLVHLYGDSIMRGAALGKFEDGSDPLPTTDPLYVWRSPASMANDLLAANGRPERFAYCGGPSVGNIAARVASGVIRAGDTVVLEDAGDYSAGPNAYYSWWWSILGALNAAGVTVVMETQYDYCFNNNMICQSPGMQYDLQVASQGTLNDATRRAFLTTVNATSASGNAYAHTRRFIDMNWVMDSWRNSALSVDGVDVMRSDGCHPNVWGQAKLVQQLLAVTGLRPYIVNTSAQQDLAAANYMTLGYGTTNANWTPARARTYVSVLLGAP